MPTASRAKLLAHCRSLPHVTEDVKWGADLCFSIGGKMFAAFEKDGSDASFGCKVAEEDFAALTAIEGIEPAPYAARYHWIKVKDARSLPAADLLALLGTSYALVLAKLPKKTQAALGAPPTPAKKKTLAEKTPTKRAR